MKKLKILLILLVALLCFSIVSCGEAESEKNSKFYTVHFELCTDLPTNRILDRKVESGGYIDEPSVAVRGENPEQMQIVGWYEDEEYTALWDFDFDTVDGNITLYAKWESRFTVNFYLGNRETPVVTKVVKKERTVEPIKDETVGYEVFGFYTSRDYDTEFDFDAPITDNTNIYIKISEQIFFDGESIEKKFVPFAGKGGTQGQPTAGNISYEEKTLESGEIESYARADFGFSNSADPYIAGEYLDIDITKSQSLEITFKNLGDAFCLRFFWVVKDSNGTFLGKDTYNSSNQKTVLFSNDASKRNMSEDDDWIVIKINLAEENENWRNAKSLYKLRIDAGYNSTAPQSNPDWKCKEGPIDNVILIKSIRGVYDENYDNTKAVVTYHCGEDVFYGKADLGEKLIRNDAACIGYEVIGYYTDEAFSTEYDFNNTVNGNMDIYVKTTDAISIDVKSIVKYFSIDNSAGGSITLSEDEEYAIVNFGDGDNPYVVLNGIPFLRRDCKKIQITLKNLSAATSFGFLWVGQDGNGEWVGGERDNRFTGNNSYYTPFTGNMRNMSLEGDCITITIDLTDKTTWADIETLYRIRFESNHSGASAGNLTNVWYIKEIKGIV